MKLEAKLPDRGPSSSLPSLASTVLLECAKPTNRFLMLPLDAFLHHDDHTATTASYRNRYDNHNILKSLLHWVKIKLIKYENFQKKSTEHSIRDMRDSFVYNNYEILADILK